MMKQVLPFLLLSFSAAKESSHERVAVPISLPELEIQANGNVVDAYNTTDEGAEECSVSSETCTSPLVQLLEIQDKEKRSQFIAENGITVEHSFMNDASERFLYIENFQSTSELLVGEAGAAPENVRRDDDSFLQLTEKQCPTGTEGTCYTIEKDHGQLFAMKFKDVPYIMAFDNGSFSDAWVEGIAVFDSSRFERVLSSGLWVLEESTGSQTVSIRNVGTGRRLFADKEDRFGGSPGAENESINDDQKWRHCVRYSHGVDRRLDCSRYI